MANYEDTMEAMRNQFNALAKLLNGSISGTCREMAIQRLQKATGEFEEFATAEADLTPKEDISDSVPIKSHRLTRSNKKNHDEVSKNPTIPDNFVDLLNKFMNL